jgi:hypothetical protein
MHLLSCRLVSVHVHQCYLKLKPARQNADSVENHPQMMLQSVFDESHLESSRADKQMLCAHRSLGSLHRHQHLREEVQRTSLSLQRDVEESFPHDLLSADLRDA